MAKKKKEKEKERRKKRTKLQVLTDFVTAQHILGETFDLTETSIQKSTEIYCQKTGLSPSEARKELNLIISANVHDARKNLPTGGVFLSVVQRCINAVKECQKPSHTLRVSKKRDPKTKELIADKEEVITTPHDRTNEVKYLAILSKLLGFDVSPAAIVQASGEEGQEAIVINMTGVKERKKRIEEYVINKDGPVLEQADIIGMSRELTII
jgi:hypothetical protein